MLQPVSSADFAAAIIDRYTSFCASISSEASRVFLEENFAPAVDSRPLQYHTTIRNLTHIVQYFQHTDNLTLRLSLGFLEHLLTGAVRELSDPVSRSALLLEKPAALRQTQNTVLLDRTLTKKLFSQQLAPVFRRDGHLLQNLHTEYQTLRLPDAQIGLPARQAAEQNRQGPPVSPAAIFHQRETAPAEKTAQRETTHPAKRALSRAAQELPAAQKPRSTQDSAQSVKRISVSDESKQVLRRGILNDIKTDVPSSREDVRGSPPASPKPPSPQNLPPFSRARLHYAYYGQQAENPESKPADAPFVATPAARPFAEPPGGKTADTLQHSAEPAETAPSPAAAAQARARAAAPGLPPETRSTQNAQHAAFSPVRRMLAPSEVSHTPAAPVGAAVVSAISFLRRKPEVTAPNVSVPPAQRMRSPSRIKPLDLPAAVSLRSPFAAPAAHFMVREGASTPRSGAPASPAQRVLPAFAAKQGATAPKNTTATASKQAAAPIFAVGKTPLAYPDSRQPLAPGRFVSPLLQPAPVPSTPFGDLAAQIFARLPVPSSAAEAPTLTAPPFAALQAPPVLHRLFSRKGTPSDAPTGAAPAQAPAMIHPRKADVGNPQSAAAAQEDLPDDIQTIQKIRTVQENRRIYENRTVAINAPGETPPASSQPSTAGQAGAIERAQVELIADQVYKAIEKRLRTEKTRLGR